MKETKNSRRQFIVNTGGGLGFFSLPSLLHSEQGKKEISKKIVCVGGHPDDAESGCGGTLAKLANNGHKVTIIYLTTGEAGIVNRSHSEAAAIRKREAVEACRILNAKPVFAGQVDGDTIIDNSWVNKMQLLIEAEAPDIVFTHWPLDYHKDHQIASLLVIQAWMRMEHRFHLFFFEVDTGAQTVGFHPTDYVDISETQQQKKRAMECHVSQHPQQIYSDFQDAREKFRGLELGVKAGEAFVRMNGRGQGGWIG